MYNPQTFTHPAVEAIWDAINAAALDKDELKTLYAVELALVSPEVETAIDYEAGRGFNPSWGSQRFNLHAGVKELVRVRKHLIRVEIPDRDSRAARYYEIRSLLQRICLETDGALRWMEAHGLSVDDYVTDGELERARAEIRSGSSTLPA